MTKVDKYENEVGILFDYVRGCNAEMTKVMTTCFEGEEIKYDDDPESTFNLGRAVLSRAQVLADKANIQFLDGRYKKMTVKKDEYLNVDIYGDDHWLASVYMPYEPRQMAQAV